MYNNYLLIFVIRTIMVLIVTQLMIIKETVRRKRKNVSLHRSLRGNPFLKSGSTTVKTAFVSVGNGFAVF